jgi:hypothetical protein
VKNFFLTYLAILLLPGNVAADIIFFKDGMKTVCQERAWEEGNEIKCEYEGTVLTYQKNDVLRIEKTKIKKELEKPTPAEEVAVKPTHQVVKQAIETDLSAPEEKFALNKESQPTLDDSASAETKGLEFYNPRRPHKYWTSATAKHDTFKTAIAALAKQYDRSPDWIQHHMGDTNDLEQIHRNLANSKLNASPTIQADEGEKLPETLFYDPRRPQKYWTSTTAKHDTFKEAVSALAKTYDCSPEWIQQHMGNTNNLSEIHHNLAKAKSADARP